MHLLFFKIQHSALCTPSASSGKVKNCYASKHTITPPGDVDSSPNRGKNRSTSKHTTPKSSASQINSPVLTPVGRNRGKVEFNLENYSPPTDVETDISALMDQCAENVEFLQSDGSFEVRLSVVAECCS
jgi:hypothetical protein